MASRNSSRVLTDHDEIRRWAEERDARPSAVQRTHTDDSVGIIRLDFPGYSGENSLEEIEWDEWFDKFDDNNLALIVQDEEINLRPLIEQQEIECPFTKQIYHFREEEKIQEHQSPPSGIKEFPILSSGKEVRVGVL
jgi:hypothetical protein